MGVSMYNLQNKLTHYCDSLIVGITDSCYAKTREIRHHYFSIYLNWLFVLSISIIAILYFSYIDYIYIILNTVENSEPLNVL